MVKRWAASSWLICHGAYVHRLLRLDGSCSGGCSGGCGGGRGGGALGEAVRRRGAASMSRSGALRPRRRLRPAPVRLRRGARRAAGRRLLALGCELGPRRRVRAGRGARGACAGRRRCRRLLSRPPPRAGECARPRSCRHRRVAVVCARPQGGVAARSSTCCCCAGYRGSGAHARRPFRRRSAAPARRRCRRCSSPDSPSHC